MALACAECGEAPEHCDCPGSVRTTTPLVVLRGAALPGVPHRALQLRGLPALRSVRMPAAPVTPGDAIALLERIAIALERIADVWERVFPPPDRRKP